MLERSTAALCPSVAYQLAGAKKVQQDLAQPGILARFVDRPEDAELLQACFAGICACHHPVPDLLHEQQHGKSHQHCGAACSICLQACGLPVPSLSWEAALHAGARVQHAAV